MHVSVKQMKPYIILEIANTHAGDKNYVFNLLEEYKKWNGNFGIKFQPFKYDEIAREDYEWYPVYKTLFFDEATWRSIISKAAETKQVWIDVSNQYSLKIFSQNEEHISGIKFQASILENIQLLKGLQKIDLSKKTIIINIASLSIEQIRYHLNNIQSQLNPGKIILQVGFQDYPTRLEDSGLSKIKTLINTFHLPISFADHIDGTLTDSIDLPVAAYLNGAEMIEKHVMCSGEKAKYDHFSSQTPEMFEQFMHKIEHYTMLLEAPFVNEREINYYKKTVMKPTLAATMKSGQIISLEKDVNYKRTNADGIDIERIKSLNEGFHVLSTDKQEGEMLQETDFKPACIASIIAGRLKSSRLPKKAILKVNSQLTSVELCIKNSMKFAETKYTILATSTSEEDSELKNYTYHKDVVFHKGDPDDVIQRYLDIIDQLNIDVFVRITADMPYVSKEIVSYLLKSHFETGADYTAPKQAAIGQGVQIINASALRKVREYFPVSDFSEYMNAYIIYNPQLFKINEIDLPKEWIRDYRLTLDYPEDLEMIRATEAHFENQGKDYNLNDLFEYLDEHPEVVNINKGLSLVYKADPKLVEEIKRRTTYVAKS